MARIEILRRKEKIITAMQEWLENWSETGLGCRDILDDQDKEAKEEILVGVDALLLAPLHDEIKELENMEVSIVKKAAKVSKTKKSSRSKGARKAGAC